MSRIIKQDEVERKIIRIRNKSVIVDSDVAELYGVSTKQVNQAVSRNPEKFPDGYVYLLEKQEKEEVVTNCDHLYKLKFSPKLPRVFTESGLYMLATILKSSRATETTISIIDTFTKVREIERTVNQIAVVEKNPENKNELVQRAGELISELIVPEAINNAETEASVELNFALVKFKYLVKKKHKR